MMWIGIDFGLKKIGIALSDTRGTMAFPHVVLQHDSGAITAILQIISDKKVGAIVMGDTLAQNGAENEVTSEARAFGARLEKEASIPLYWVSEAGTSGAARMRGEEGAVRGVTQSPAKAQKDDLHDARAAALILQRFLDTQQGARPI